MAGGFFDSEEDTLPMQLEQAMTVGSSRPEATADAQNEFGLPGGYNNQALRLSAQQTMHEQNAMNYLKQAMSASEVTPTQGIAAALLGAIPTLGGYLIGSAVGDPDIPEGITGFDRTKYQTGGFAGGLMGAQTGLKAGEGYLANIDATNKQKQDILEKMAGLESSQAARADSQEANILSAGLAAKERRDFALDPVRRKAELDDAIALTKARQAASPYGGGGVSQLPPKMLEQLGLDPNGQYNNKTIATALSLQKEGGINSRFDERMEGNALMPPSKDTKTAMTSALQAKALGERYIGQLENIGKQNPSYLERSIDSALPATELGNLQKNMGLFAVQIRNARENGIMTEEDFKRYSSYLTIGPLDTVNSVLGRMKELQTVTDLSAKATLTAAKAGQENVSGYEKLFGFNAPTVLQSQNGASTNTPSSRMGNETKEDFIKRRTAEIMRGG